MNVIRTNTQKAEFVGKHARVDAQSMLKSGEVFATEIKHVKLVPPIEIGGMSGSIGE